MPVFQVSSRSVQLAAPPKKKPRRLRQEWSAAIRFVAAISAAGWFIRLVDDLQRVKRYCLHFASRVGIPRCRAVPALQLQISPIQSISQ